MKERFDMEILRFIFSSFWVFCGVVILIYTFGLSVSMIISSFFRGDGNYSLITIGKGDKPDENEPTKPLDVDYMTGKSNPRMNNR